MVNMKQLPDGSMGMEGSDKDSGAFVMESIAWNPNSVDTVFFVAPRAMIVQSIMPRVEVAGTDVGAVTAVIRKVASGTALTSGTALHSGSINLKGTAATNQSLTLSTTATTLALAAGDALAIDFTGTLTSAVGAVTVGMNPA